MMSKLGVHSANAQASDSSAAARGRSDVSFRLLACLLLIQIAGWIYLDPGPVGGAKIPSEGVLTSGWAHGVGGIRVGWLLAAGYAVMLGALCATRFKVSAWLSRTGWRLLLMLAVSLLAISICLTVAGVLWTQANAAKMADVTDFVRETNPVWLAVNGLGIVASIVALWRLGSRRKGSRSRDKSEASAGGERFSGADVATLLVYGLALFALVVGPALAETLLSAVRAAGHPMAKYRKTGPLGHTYYDTGPGPDRRFMTSYDVDVRPHEAPVLGSADAAQFVFFWFDYTDLRSREQYQNLKTAVDRYGGQIAIVPLPFPINGSCNSAFMFQDTGPTHADACRYARLALAVWKARPTAFADFHAWLFEPRILPAFDEARRHAADVVGEEALTMALADPRIDEMFFRGIALNRTGQSPHGRLVPRVGLPSDLIGGQHLLDPENFDEIFRTQLGLEPVPAPLPAGGAGP